MEDKTETEKILESCRKLQALDKAAVNLYREREAILDRLINYNHPELLKTLTQFLCEVDARAERELASSLMDIILNAADYEHKRLQRERGL